VRFAFGKIRLAAPLRRLARDERGVSAVTIAISVAVLAPMALGIFDVFSISEQGGKLQDALDAATLYAARSPVYTTAEVDAIGDKALLANLQMIHGASLQSSNFTLQGNKVVADASVQLAAYAPMEFTHPVQVHSEVTRAGANLEVALVLDNTGSMAGAPMTQLQSAANQLVDLVVSDAQTPYSTKMSIVPYSNAVNAGTYVDAVRGTPTAAQAPLQAACIDNPGCAKMTFHSGQGGNHATTLNVTNCVSERTGAEAFTDADTTFNKVGWVYAGSGNPCIGTAVQPMTSDKTALHNLINGLTAGGSTAGHVGLAWGWYTVSPNWSGMWPSGSQPAAYGADHVVKAVILMTDGAFNTAYCRGAISNVTSDPAGSGSASDHSNCAAPNGDSFTQAQTLCAAMKHAPDNIVIYTVGFLHGGADPQAEAIMQACATDAQHYYLPTTGTSLSVAFQSIAADLNRMRITH
jgi:Flp pilus assembly protein TadG